MIERLMASKQKTFQVSFCAILSVIADSSQLKITWTISLHGGTGTGLTYKTAIGTAGT